MFKTSRVLLKTAWIVLILILAAPLAAPRDATEDKKESKKHESKEQKKKDGQQEEAKEEKKEEKREERREEAAKLPAVLWHNPGDVSKLNCLYGPGGKAHAPNPKSKYTFLEENLNGQSPKFDVKDDHGVRWRVKMGQEPQAETAASRLLWAAGYYVDEDYYLAKIKVKGLPAKLAPRGNWFSRRRESKDQKLTFISPNGTVLRVRLKRRLEGVKTIEDEWDWFDNPFAGTKEFDGLRVMMSLVNNWDLSSDNNKVRLYDSQRRYMVTDLGATFGKTGNPMHRSKSVLADYAASPFMEKVTPESVDFVMHSRPPSLEKYFKKENYIKRTRIEEIPKQIPRAHARWLGERLARLSEKQIRDCFRAAGYAPQAVEAYTKAVEKRITELNAL